MPEIRKSSDKGKEIVTSTAKKVDLIKRESKEKLTLRRENEYLLGGTDRGEPSSKRRQTTEQQATRRQTTEQQAAGEPSDAEVDGFFATLRSIRAMLDTTRAQQATQPARTESQRQSTSQPWQPTFIMEDFTKDPFKPAEK